MNADRRQFLTTTALATGGPLLAPIVHKIRAELAGAPLPKRFVFVVEGNGCNWDQIQPKGIERKKNQISQGGYTGRSAGEIRENVIDIALTKHDLPTALEPVAEFKDKLTIIQGISGKMNGGGHSNDFGALGAYNHRGASAPFAETIDYALGRKLGGVYSQIGLGISDREEDTVINNCSASGKGSPLPTQCRPDLAYQALFGFASGGNARKEFDTRKNLLDYMAADVKRAEAAVTGPDREKLGSYLAAFEGMRARHGRLAELEATVRKNAPPVTDKFKSVVETDRLDAHFDNAAGALVAGLTNVVTIASGVGNPYFSVAFKGLGLNYPKHGIGHGGSYMGMTWDVLAVKIRRFHFEMIARLAKKLNSVKEGNGTMLDNTCIVYLSDAAEGHHSRCFEWPMVLLGNLGGKLKAGRYVELPGHGAKNHKHIGNLYCTLLHAAGHPRDTFGQPDPILGRDVDQKGPIGELLT